MLTWRSPRGCFGGNIFSISTRMPWLSFRMVAGSVGLAFVGLSLRRRGHRVDRATPVVSRQPVGGSLNVSFCGRFGIRHAAHGLGLLVVFPYFASGTCCSRATEYPATPSCS
jgi:hypothetical protein